MQETEHKTFGSPDETREFPNGKAEILSVGGAEIGRLALEPGWRWSNDVKPIAGTDAWVVGDEPAVVVDWYGASNYAKRA